MTTLTLRINGTPTPVVLGENTGLASRYANEAEVSAAAALGYRDSAQTSQLAAEAAADIATSGGTYYNTKAAADADLASIAADAYITVLADEGQGGGRTTYQKSAGVLVLRSRFNQFATVDVDALTGSGGVGTRALSITTGSYGYDKGILITQAQGALSGVDIRKQSTGSFLRCFEDAYVDGGEGTLATWIGDGAQILTRKWQIISGTYTGTLNAEGAGDFTIHPGSTRRNMFSVWSDLELCMELRPPSTAAANYLLSGLTGDNKETFALEQTGELRFSGLGVVAGDYLNPLANNLNTHDLLPIRIKPLTDERTLYFHQGRPLTYGAVNLRMQSDGALQMEDSGGTARNVIYFEGGEQFKIGSGILGNTLIYAGAGGEMHLTSINGVHVKTGDLHIDAGKQLLIGGVNAGAAAVIVEAGAAYTFALTDANDVVEFTSGSAVTATVPPNSTVALPIGTMIEVHQAGAGQVTIAPGAGVTIASRNSLFSSAGLDAVIGLRKVAADKWRLTGDLV